jgi:NuA3 HAT complex component NTO1
MKLEVREKSPIASQFADISQFLQQLREDLEKVRVLAEYSRKRESRKHKQAEIIHDILTRFLFPHEAVLRHAFERITRSVGCVCSVART